MNTYSYLFLGSKLPNLKKNVTMNISGPSEISVTGEEDVKELLNKFRTSLTEGKAQITDFSSSSEGNNTSISEIEYHFDERINRSHRHVISHCVIEEFGNPIERIDVSENAYFVK